MGEEKGLPLSLFCCLKNFRIRMERVPRKPEGHN